MRTPATAPSRPACRAVGATPRSRRRRRPALRARRRARRACLRFCQESVARGSTKTISPRGASRPQRPRPRSWPPAGRRRRRSPCRGCRGGSSGCRRRSSRRTNSFCTGTSDAVQIGAGRRVERDRVHVHPAAAAGVELLGEQVGAPGVVVHVLDERVLDRDAPTGLVEVVARGVERLVDLPARVHRDELVAQLVVGRVQRQRERDRDVLVRELRDRRARAPPSRP